MYYFKSLIQNHSTIIEELFQKSDSKILTIIKKKILFIYNYIQLYTERSRIGIIITYFFNISAIYLVLNIFVER